MPLDFREARHLPKVRGDEGADPRGLPRQRRGTTPQMHGRYPDYDCLESAEHWDDLTRRVVVGRVDRVPELRFFTPVEAARSSMRRGIRGKCGGSTSAMARSCLARCRSTHR